LGYNHEPFKRDEVDERALLGLRGELRTSPTIRSGRAFKNLEDFAMTGERDEIAVPTIPNEQKRVDGIGL
jgi:hypothetical protein